MLKIAGLLGIISKYTVNGAIVFFTSENNYSVQKKLLPAQRWLSKIIRAARKKGKLLEEWNKNSRENLPFKFTEFPLNRF